MRETLLKVANIFDNFYSCFEFLFPRKKRRFIKAMINDLGGTQSMPQYTWNKFYRNIFPLTVKDAN